MELKKWKAGVIALKVREELKQKHHDLQVPVSYTDFRKRIWI